MILVTGASGSVGKEVLRAVAKTGAKHRAMYRSANEAAKAVGTAAVIADFAKPETLGPALADVQSVYLVCSPIPELVQLESNAIDACVAAGVNYVDIPMEAQRKAMLDQGMPEWQVKALLELQEYYLAGQGGTVDGLLQKLLGRPPVSMDQFLAEFVGEFRAQATNA